MRLLVVSLLSLLATSAACRNPSVPSTGDASITPLDPGEATLLADAFLEARAVRGQESCRCAGDVPFCRQETDPPLSADARACLEMNLDRGGVAFRSVIPCLRQAADAYAMCGASLSCPEVEARMACKDAYETAGSACFAGDGALGGLLFACLPESS